MLIFLNTCRPWNHHCEWMLIFLNTCGPWNHHCEWMLIHNGYSVTILSCWFKVIDSVVEMKVIFPPQEEEEEEAFSLRRRNKRHSPLRRRSKRHSPRHSPLRRRSKRHSPLRRRSKRHSPWGGGKGRGIYDIYDTKTQKTRTIHAKLDITQRLRKPEWIMPK